MCHLDYVQKATLNDFGAWKHAVDSLADMMEPFAARINAAVCTQMKEGLADAQLRGYYYLMTKLSIWTGDDCEQLKIRLEILDMCSRFKSSLSLRKLLLMRYSCSEDGHAKDVAAIIASGPEFIRFHGSLSELLSRYHVVWNSLRMVTLAFTPI